MKIRPLGTELFHADRQTDRQNFPDRFSKNTQISNFMKIRPVGTELFQADGQTGNFLDRFSKNTQISNFMKIRPVGSEFHADGQTEFSRQIFEKYSNIKSNENPSSGNRVAPCRWTDRQTGRDITNLIVAFRNSATTPKNY
jgi:hypothetical protein